MWRSPGTERGVGRKYSPRELSALIYPLDIMLDTLSFRSPKETVSEAILQQMDEDELVFGLHQVFQALLTDLSVPKGEHPGYQEAMIAELLDQMYELVETERLFEADGTFDAEPDPDPGAARRAAWTSYFALCHRSGTVENLADRLGLDISDPDVYLSPKLTDDEWESMLVTGGLLDTFLWDTDWRLEKILDLPEKATEEVRELMGYDLETVHLRPPQPSLEELETATHYLRRLGTMIE